jgi:signal transduction histidine kinase
VTGFKLGGTRRAALNEALHELRRPLQALVLAVDPGRATAAGVESSLLLVTAAVDRLDDEINGRGPARSREAVSIRPLLEAAVKRWRPRARLSGAELNIVGAPKAVIEGEPVGLAQALDNLIVNAIEHGGPVIELGARRHGRRLRIAIADSGRDGPCPRRRRATGAAIARLAAAGRRGHGLNIVRRVASAHGGRFELRHSELGSVATLDLPLADERA